MYNGLCVIMLLPFMTHKMSTKQQCDELCVYTEINQNSEQQKPHQVSEQLSFMQRGFDVFTNML